MNMIISPASTHSYKLRDPLVDVIGYNVVWDVRNTNDFKPCFWEFVCCFENLSLFYCSFKEKIHSNVIDLWICTWFV